MEVALPLQIDFFTVAPYAVSERLPVLGVNTKQEDLLVLSAYAPTLGADPDIKDFFYNQLEDTVGKASPSARIIILGDINTRVATDYMSWPECLGKFSSGKINENGLRLLEFFSRNNIFIKHSFFSEQKPQKSVLVPSSLLKLAPT
ncbi:hypothetical protein EB796_012913 [Bugula neritina]|uniref:Endonuclease/exonuclease/phosphatase domain-containing protein n=1 Tax=Bugula neritina TaxID=10212 RepID=A0A7J7JS93_BUGNE|nr:hypothetical protein EB796_012913 [Bugula neritina]